MEGIENFDIWADYPCLRPLPPSPDPDLCATCVTALEALLRIDSKDLPVPGGRHERGDIRTSKAAEIPHHATTDALQRSAAQECPICLEILTNLQQAGREQLNHPLLFVPVIEELDTSVAPIEFGFRYFEVSGLCTFKIEYESGDALTIAGRAAQKFMDFGLARKWVAECEENHPRCRKSELRVLPTRVIEILWGRSFVPRLKLVDGAGRKAHYMTLSHCWGDPKLSPPTTTTKANLEAHKSSLDFMDLPNTFQDAVMVARDLRFQYLWIDSICIVQDSEEDRIRECGRMDEIYRDASLTLAVADVCCSNCGFLQPCCEKVCQLLKKGHRKYGMQSLSKSEPRGFNVKLFEGSEGMETSIRIVPATYFIGGDKSKFFGAVHWVTETFHPSTLDERAWTFQERLLSSRVLRLCSGEIGMECESARFYENMRYPVTELNPNFDSLVGGRTIPKNFLTLDYTFYDIWGQLVYEYSQRRLTYGGDRLLALAGIASFLAKRTGDRFLGGMWEKDLARGLAWYSLTDSDNKPQNPVYLFPPERPLPSWSWASCATPIRAPQVGYNFQSLIELHAADSRALELLAFIRPLDRSRLQQCPSERFDEPNFSYKTDTQAQLTITTIILLDDPGSDRLNWLDAIEHDASLACMLLGKYADDDKEPHSMKHCMWYALLLQQVSDEPPTYKRLGIIENKNTSDFENSTQALQWLKSAGQRQVRLV